MLGGGAEERTRRADASTPVPPSSKTTVVSIRKRQRSSMGSRDSVGSYSSLGVVSNAQVAEAVQLHPELVILSLRTLGTLSTPSPALLPLLQRTVAPYMGATDEAIRSEAATTCLRLIAAPTQPFRARGPTAIATDGLISLLLDTAVSDASPVVRSTVLKFLVGHGDFDKYLCQAHHISTIMFLLSDESFEIRGGALSVLGRLANLNPSVVLPRLRQVVFIIHYIYRILLIF